MQTFSGYILFGHSRLLIIAKSTYEFAHINNIVLTIIVILFDNSIIIWHLPARH